MLTNETPVKLTYHGAITIEKDEIMIMGFEADGASCRDAAALACLWGIGMLQKELTELMQAPGGGISVMA